MPSLEKVTRGLLELCQERYHASPSAHVLAPDGKFLQKNSRNSVNPVGQRLEITGPENRNSWTCFPVEFLVGGLFELGDHSSVKGP